MALGLATALLLGGMSPVAFAQDPAAQPPAEAPAAPAQEAAPAAPAAETPPPAEPAVNPALEEKIITMQGQLEGMAEPFSAMQTDVAALKRIKLSGYVQGRYEWHDDANYGLEGTRRRETNRFYVRRGRIKTTYVGDFSEFVLQIDATGDGVVLRDAEASLVLTNENPWVPSSTPWELKLTMGQFKIPFGFEVLQSSSDREMPERSTMVLRLFPGERDRGVRLQWSYDWLRIMAAIINGNFTNDPDHGTFDQTSWKDFVGRVQADLDVFVIGASVHTGRFLKLVRQPTTAMPVAGYERYSRLRVGTDAQAYLDVPNVGGLTLRGEFIWAKDEQMSFAETPPPANRCNDQTRLGWSATVVQNIGDHFGVVARVDQYDPTNSVDDACNDTKVRGPAETDKTTNVGGGLLWYVSGNLKVSAIYEHFGEQGMARDNDAFTLQMQARF